MHAMDAATRDELRMLRARAFGPSADIQGDPAALERLRELEDLALEPVDETPSPLVETDAPASEPESILRDADPAVEAGAPATAAAGGRIPLRVHALWGASLVATAAVATALTAGLTPTIAVSHDADVTLVGTVEVDDSAEWPVFMGQRADGALVFEDFLGLTAMTQGEDAFAPQGIRCMSVVLTDYRSRDDSYVGPSFWGCGAGDFPVRVPVMIDEAAPDLLRERFAAGTALEFVLDGDRVGIFSDAD